MTFVEEEATVASGCEAAALALKSSSKSSSAFTRIDYFAIPIIGYRIVSAVLSTDYFYENPDVDICLVTLSCVAFTLYSCFHSAQKAEGKDEREHMSLRLHITQVLAIIYVHIVILCLSVHPSILRSFIHVHLFPDIQHQKLHSHSASDDCSIQPRNLHTKFFDIYTCAHLLGWIGKSILFRSYKLSWLISVMFELCEITFAGVVPDFNECWWDSVLLDIFGMNFIGMVIGISVQRHVFNIQPFHWFDDEKTNSAPVPFISKCLLILLLLAVEVSAFFMKQIVLQIPPANVLNIIRLLLWLLLGSAALSEFYRNNLQPGRFTYLAFSAVALEFLLITKFTLQLQHAIFVFDSFHLACWALFLALLSCYFVAKFYLAVTNRLVRQTLFAVAFAPLLTLLVVTKWPSLM